MKRFDIIVIVLIVNGITNGVVNGDDTFYFNPKPSDKTVIEGKSIVIECGSSNNEHITIHWTHNDNRVVNDSRRFQQNGNLVIKSADRDTDLGQFTCVITDVTSGRSISYTIELKVLWLNDNVKVNLHSIKLENGTNNPTEMTLHCIADGNPEPRSEWFLNGNRLNKNKRILIRKKEIHITNLTVADNGIYSCSAISDAGKIDSTENYHLKIKSPNVAHLIDISKNMIVKPNTDVIFNCVYENAAAIEWYAQNKDLPLSNNSKITIFTNGTLAIRNAETTDAGIYKCVGLPLTKDSPSQTYSTRLNIAYINDFDDTPFGAFYSSQMQMYIVPKNHPNFELFCIPPNGVPKPKVWYEDPNKNIISDSGKVRVEENKLIIEGPIKKSDAGKYKCVAENDAGQRRKVLDIYVTNPPTVSDPYNVIADEDATAVIHCSYTGSPHTTVKWLKDGRFMRQSNHFTMANNGSLIIKSVNINDAGKYNCEVSSIGFNPIKSKEANLTVREKLKFSSPPTNTNLELNSNAKIYCKAKGYVPATVKWNKEGLPWFEWPLHIRDTNGTLHFDGVKSQDSGNYTCIATSSQGVINITIRVFVIVMPKFSKLPEAEMQELEGTSTMMHCGADGDPTPTIQWDKDHELNRFDKERFTVFPNGTLKIEDLNIQDSGKYGCIAGNRGGLIRTQVILMVKNIETSTHLGANSEEINGKMTRTLTITLGAAALYMLLVMALMVWCRYRRAKRKSALLAQTNDEPKPENGDLEMRERRDANETCPEQHRLLNADDKNRQQNNKPLSSVRIDGDAHSQSSGSHSSKRSKSPYDKIQYQRTDFQKLCLLGHGEFGEVFLAKSNCIRNGESEQIVMIKSLETKDENVQLEFKREMEMFYKLNHERVVKLIGICRETEPFLLVMEYSDWGDLKQFLLATRQDNVRRGPKPTPLTLPQIIGICQQIAYGMEYVTSNRFVHKDLATRNCLITSKLEVKVSSTSLSKDTYSPEYYNYRNRDIPIRWASYEAVFEDEWSAKSDVYSFSVLISEIFSRAELPFSDKSDATVMQLMKKHELRLEPPNGIPKRLRDLMIQCCSKSPKERPTFTDVCHHLNQVLLDIPV